MAHDEGLDVGSLFHEGEIRVQKKAGVEGDTDLGRRNIHDYMPQQHREFYHQQSLIFIAAQDKQQRPWASVIVGKKGLLKTPTENEMVISGLPFSNEPIQEGLAKNDAVGLLGLDFGSRRRNRMNGRIKSRLITTHSPAIGEIADSLVRRSLTISVDQAFGNCPKYIQSRIILDNKGMTTVKKPLSPLQHSHKFSEEQRQLIEAADTFFIATQHLPDELSTKEKNSSRELYGIDMSHRGGKPGFIKFVDNNTIQWPDFNGNAYFNTLGNLQQDPRAGLLFLDFKTGSMLSVTGHAEVIWDGIDINEYEGAERLVRFKLDEAVYIPNAYPLKWSTVDASPFLAATDSWIELENRRKYNKEIEKKTNQYQSYKVVKVQDETKDIRSFYLEATSKQPLAPLSLPFKAGQFLPIKIKAADGKTHFRSYSLSDSPSQNHYRISVKRLVGDAPGLVSNLLHEQLQVGSLLESMSPKGEFVLSDNQRPVVLLSAGVGITPMISMLQSIIEDNVRTGANRLIYFIYGTQHSQNHAFRDLVDSIAKTTPWLKVAYCYSQQSVENETFTRQNQDKIQYFSGHVNKQVLQQILPIDDYEFYLCGPSEFMTATYQLLTELNITKERINYEFFGHSTILNNTLDENTLQGEATQSDKTRINQDNTKSAKAPVIVKFTRSQKETVWKPELGSLLELAESEGLSPDFGCRNGQCHACITTIKKGKVHQSVGSVSDNAVLICCATPELAHEAELKNQPLLLDL
ncbi:hypothetical protein A9Q74_13260 [Colwellia sp. 39_35_sub15_T18]|nr:hypothetical protein A9Q74_13260 [Colwellia sp. 39_35_sub15_T18]